MPPADSTSSHRAVLVAIFLAALLLRSAHNDFVMDSPLYFVPLGGHVFDLQLGERIANGEWLPFDGPITLNSPLYPYFVAIPYRLAPGAALLFVRLAGILLDSITCVLISVLACRNFGRIAGGLAGLAAAAYGPLIFYAAEPMPVTLTVFLLTAGVLLLDIGGGRARHLLAGLCAGLAAGTRPDVLLLAVLLVPAPLALRRAAAIRCVVAFALGVALAISPVTLINYLASGRFVLLSASGGHNFYLGHRPGAGAGYALPVSMDGDIFASMKKAAEDVEGRRFADDEVSGYYVREAWRNIAADPAAEAARVFTKLAAAVNDFEASTYVNFYFARELSPVLRGTLSFGTLFPLAALGAVLYFRRYLLIAPIAGTFLTLVAFFYIARLRMPMTPFLVVLAGGACVRVGDWFAQQRWRTLTAASTFLVLVAYAANRPTARIDVSNEWNKVGIVLRAQQKYEEAERALMTARDRNPGGADAYLNLAVLYEKMGRTEDANRMREEGACLVDQRERERFLAGMRRK